MQHRAGNPLIAGLILTAVIHLGYCHKVLIIPLPAKSHMFQLIAIGQELVLRGHEVHMLLLKGFPLPSELTANGSAIKLLFYADATRSNTESIDSDAYYEKLTYTMMSGNFHFSDMINGLKEMVEIIFRSYLAGNDKLFQDMTEYRYDIAVVDTVYFGKFQYLIPHRLGIPWVTFTDFPNPWVMRAPWLPSFHAFKFSPLLGEMTFFERLWNTFTTLGLCRMPDPPAEMLNFYRQYGDFNSMDDLAGRSRLFIVTMDVALDQSLPIPPNMIPAAGLTAKPAGTKPLPKDLVDFIAAAKTGIIVVSFGSLAPSLPKAVAQKFIDVFSRLPDLHVIWRFVNRDNLIIPKNVMTSKWLPQNELLAHPRTKVFITHCGNNGQFEAVYHGVPMIGFPFVLDQVQNAMRIGSKGHGFSMDIREFSAEELFDNMQKILTDPSYKKRVTLASEILKSALRSPAQRAGDGIEHVLRFGGDHLRPAGSDLPLYQYLMLDVLAFIVFALLVVVVVVWKIFRFVLKLIIGNLKEPEKAKAL